jgi:DnaK suppressor protein
MTKSQIRHFCNLLEANRAELRRSLYSLRDRLLVDANGDTLDRICGATDHEFTLESLTLETETLHKVEDALARIREGSYGVCERCGRDIPLQRLNAVPWASYCVPCQEAREVIDSVAFPTAAGVPHALAG